MLASLMLYTYLKGYTTPYFHLRLVSRCQIQGMDFGGMNTLSNRPTVNEGMNIMAGAAVLPALLRTYYARERGGGARFTVVIFSSFRVPSVHPSVRPTCQLNKRARKAKRSSSREGDYNRRGASKCGESVIIAHSLSLAPKFAPKDPKREG